jgi:nucleoside-diphosphate-sugar epimerase
MRLLVTGASGFVGRNFLAAAPPEAEIVAIWRADASFPDFVASLGRPGIRPFQLDLIDADAARAAATRLGEEFDAIIHLAANGDPVRSARLPLADLDETLRAALVTFTSFRAKCLVLFSSGAVYEGASGAIGPETPCRPTLPYSLTHLAAERYASWAAREGRFGRVTVLRFFGAYGPHEPERKIYTRLCRAFALEKKKEFVLRGDGRNLIDAMYVTDAVAAVDAVLRSEVGNGVWDLSSGDAMTLRELVERAATIFNREPVTIRFEGMVSESHQFRSSPDLFASTFGFRPSIPLEQGLPELATWLATRG